MFKCIDLYMYMRVGRSEGGRKGGDGNDEVKGFQQQVVLRLCCTGIAVVETTLGGVSCSC